MKNRNNISGAILATVACFALLPIARAVVPPPDGGYPNFTTAEGEKALQHLTGGAGNTGIGAFSLFSVSTGNFNTAVGVGSLDLNQSDANTAVGAAALLFNTAGSDNTAVGAGALELNQNGNNNTANGAFALFSNLGGNANTAVGRDALFSNTTGSFNTALGHGTLESNTAADNNTAVGFFALHDNVAARNTAVGEQALDVNTIGQGNTAVGYHALFNNIIGGGNVAVGTEALLNSNTGFNIAIGAQAGSLIVTAHDVIAINSPGGDTSDTCFIGNIRGVTTDNMNAVPVLIDSAGQLGTVNSSQRFKKDIQPMESASSAVLNLKPVTFHYKTDKTNTPQFGLVAEEVAKVNPDLVIRDNDGQLLTVRYEAVNAMLLNEFLKAHKKVEQLEATVAQQEKVMEALTTQVQKVSAQIQVNKPAPQMAANNE